MDVQEIKKKRVSFSQYSMWMKCPYSWKLNYLEGKRIYDASLNIFFGTAIHHSVQTFLQSLYTESVEKADSINVFELFKVKFEEEIQKEKSKPDSKFTYTDDEYTEFVFDGEDILKTFLSTKNRLKYFPSQKYEFIGVEIPLDLPIKNNVEFIAYVDLVLKDKETGKYKIYDFKTSSNGWNKYQKEDPAKYSQILLYKAFYAKKFNVDLNHIEVEFFILKRKLYEAVDFPQSRIQIYEPMHNKQAIASTLGDFAMFVTECFTVEGDYNVSGSYPKIPGKAKKNCKYCQHHKVNCDGKADKLLD
jgi:hypothetical protein